MQINFPYTNLYLIHINPNHPFNLSDNPMDVVEKMGGDVGKNIQNLKTLDSWFQTGLRILAEYPETIPGTHLRGALQYIAEFHNRILESSGSWLHRLRVDLPLPETIPICDTQYWKNRSAKTNELYQLETLAKNPKKLDSLQKTALASQIIATRGIVEKLNELVKLTQEIRSLGINYAGLRFCGYSTESLAKFGFIRP